MSKGTLQGSNRKKSRKSGFRVRMRTPSGRRILNKKRRKERKKFND
nr:ribosomal protein L34 [Hypnea pseudomusciformis]WCH55063.1 ribosomal protein L34 [Hypnea pseudomusciformis]WCH55462.1 ribosomal protein L34 [Hypnea pseudomusciformis]WCH56656.1 ribosomal protein L34 [Hypnea pseudomusciformis]